ncbi:MAG: helix-turn-helix domain-containing protein [Clostridia bacterium]|nr:helix-turn-helix domain-containing protein [Clostridia bacterium]
MQVFKKQCQKDFAHRGKTVIFRLRNAQSQPLRERKLLLRIDYWFFIVIFVELCYNPLSQKRENRMNNRNGEVLQILRENIGLSQLEVAKRLHVRRQTISNWELCKTMVNVDDLKLLSSIYDFDFTQLLHCYTAVKNLPSREEIIRMQEDYRKSLMNKEKANDKDASQSDEQPADKPAETVETTDSLDEIALAKDDTADNADSQTETVEATDSLDEIALTEDDITENVTESEAKEKHKRKLHPLIKTALLSAGISTAVCVCIILGLIIYLRITELINDKLGNFTNKNFYAVNYAQLILLIFLIIFVSTILGTIGHFIIHLIKKKRRK